MDVNFYDIQRLTKYGQTPDSFTYHYEQKFK